MAGGLHAPRHAGPALLFGGLAILWTYPLVRHLSTHVPGLPGDNYTFLHRPAGARP